MACQHRGCDCAPSPVLRLGRTFCSDRCADMETSGGHEASCPCGHPGCKDVTKTSTSQGSE